MDALKIWLAIPFLFLFVGCASYTYNHIHTTGNGTYVYNGLPITGNMTLDEWSCIGACPPILNQEMIDNVEYSRPNTNTTK